MKKELLIALCSLLFACTEKEQPPFQTIIPIPDTVYVVTRDTIRDTIQVIPQEYLEYKLIVLNVKHYIDITEKRPANKKYFYGWIRRAVDGVDELKERDEKALKVL